jgi:hypothetical protein
MMQIILQHKEVALLCKEGMTPTKAQNALLILQVNKTLTTPKPHMEPRNISKHCINYGRDNHNIETCKVKKRSQL